MIYEDGYTSSWRLTLVDDMSWADESDLGHVASASVTKSVDSDAPSIDSANVELSSTAPAVGSYVRLWMDARANGELVRVPIVTGRVTPSTADRARSEVSEVVLPPRNNRNSRFSTRSSAW